MTGTLSKTFHKHFELVTSTNRVAAEYGPLIDLDTLLLVTAEAQSHARGRFNRRWLGPANQNLYATFGFHIDRSRKDLGNIPQVMALAVSNVLQEQGISSQLKWPNDILVDHKKIAGILAETFASTYNNKLYMIVGVGININMPAEILSTIGRPATSIYFEMGHPTEINFIRDQLLNCFLKSLNTFIEKGFPPFLENYRSRMALKKNDPISFHVSEKVIHGAFQEITSNGTLKLQLPNGEISEFVSGEIFFKKQ